MDRSGKAITKHEISQAMWEKVDKGDSQGLYCCVVINIYANTTSSQSDFVIHFNPFISTLHILTYGICDS